MLQLVGVLSTDVDLTKKPSDWRERMKQRQKFWSHSMGFKFGRKLADWGDEPEKEGKAQAGLSEDAEIQKAIALSLQDFQGILLADRLSNI